LLGSDYFGNRNTLHTTKPEMFGKTHKIEGIEASCEKDNGRISVGKK
jgi:hypothetical protein